MTRLSWVTCVLLLALPAGALALVEGCSSSNGAAPPAEAGAPDGNGGSTPLGEAGLPAVLDGGNIPLLWGVVQVQGRAPSADGGEEASSGDDAGDAGAPASEQTVDAGFYNGADGGSAALPGAQVCAYLLSDLLASGSFTAPSPSSAMTCVTTGADGTFTIPNVPVRTNMFVTASYPGFVPTLASIQTASSMMDVREYPLYLYPISTQVSAIPTFTLDYQNQGQIIVFDIGSPDAGASVAMGTGADGSAPAGVGPVYQDSMGNFVPSATTFFPPTGQLGLSLAQYFNVPAGLYTLTMTDPIDDCEPSLMPLAAWGFPLVDPMHSIQVLVFDGYISGPVGFICTPKSVIVTVDGG